MKCPHCAHAEDHVVDSREGRDGTFIRRRRECAGCRRRYTTYEYIEEVMPAVAKRDGRREPFNRGKLRDSIVNACAKYSPAFAAAGDIAADIESVIRGRAEKEVPAAELGDLALERIKRIDPVSAVRYAIAWRRIADIKVIFDLVRELGADTPKAASPARMPLKRVAGRRS